jgi:hypothetical protein
MDGQIPHNSQAIAEALKDGRLRFEPVFGKDGQLLFYALLPAQPPTPPDPPGDDRFPPTVTHDPRRTRPF